MSPSRHTLLLSIYKSLFSSSGSYTPSLSTPPPPSSPTHSLSLSPSPSRLVWRFLSALPGDRTAWWILILSLWSAERNSVCVWLICSLWYPDPLSFVHALILSLCDWHKRSVLNRTESVSVGELDRTVTIKEQLLTLSGSDSVLNVLIYSYWHKTILMCWFRLDLDLCSFVLLGLVCLVLVSVLLNLRCCRFL